MTARMPRSAVVFGGRALVVVIWLVSWQLVGQTQPVLLSYPSQVVAAFGHVILNAQLPLLLLSSGRTFVIGWVIAVGGGIVLGVLIGWLRPVALMFEPFLNAVYATPLIALIPLMVLWFGLGLRALVACVVVIAIFPMLIMTITGVRNAGRDYVEVARSFRLNRFKMLYKVVLPGAFPYVLVGLRLSTARAITGTIIAEFLIGSDGIGDALQAAGQSFATPLMFGLIITIVVFAMAVDTAMRRTTAALHMDQW